MLSITQLNDIFHQRQVSRQTLNALIRGCITDFVETASFEWIKHWERELGESDTRYIEFSAYVPENFTWHKFENVDPSLISEFYASLAPDNSHGYFNLKILKKDGKIQLETETTHGLNW